MWLKEEYIGSGIMAGLLRRFLAFFGLKQGYHLFVDNFYTSATQLKSLFTEGSLQQEPSWRPEEIFLLV